VASQGCCVQVSQAHTHWNPPGIHRHPPPAAHSPRLPAAHACSCLHACPPPPPLAQACRPPVRDARQPVRSADFPDGCVASPVGRPYHYHPPSPPARRAHAPVLGVGTVVRCGLLSRTPRPPFPIDLGFLVQLINLQNEQPNFSVTLFLTSEPPPWPSAPSWIAPD